jgi:hypothetical protein
MDANSTTASPNEHERRHHSHTLAAKAALIRQNEKADSQSNRRSSIQETKLSNSRRPLPKSVAVEIGVGVTHVARSPSCRSTPTRPAMATPSSSASGSSSSPGAAYSSGSASPYSSRIWYRIISALASPAPSAPSSLSPSALRLRHWKKHRHRHGPVPSG